LRGTATDSDYAQAIARLPRLEFLALRGLPVGDETLASMSPI